jgi:hypothetical protein
MPRPRLENAFNLVAAGILLLSLVLGGLWLLFPGRMSPEPVLGFLGLLYTAVPLFGGWLVRRLRSDVETERLSLSYALAYGYLHNFLEPVVRKLWNESRDREHLRFFVYIPKTLEELNRDRIEDTLTSLGVRNYAVEKLELEFPGQKRTRDVRTARRISGGRTGRGGPVYFDFPTTLLTTQPAIQFKLDKQQGPTGDRDRNELGAEYIRDFKRYLVRFLEHDKYAAYRRNICVVDGGPNFLDRCDEAEGSSGAA